MATSGGNNSTSPTLVNVAGVVRQHYREELWQAIKTALGVITSLSLKGRDHCLVLVFEGPSGQGKSITIRVVMSNRASTEKYLHRVDDFTPASFVSHAANRKEKHLKEIDLLPKIRDKVMLTKELAPLFRDDEKEMRQNFARLTSVLDGNGYITASGTHGKRGYDGRYVFNWIGGTTPIPHRTHKVMAQLGNRILFHEIAAEDYTDDNLMDFAKNYGTIDAIEECQKAVNDFIEAHFQKHPVESVNPASIQIHDHLLKELVHYANLIAHGRVEVERNESGDVEAETREAPQRIILLLQTLVRGLALANGRSSVTAEDLDVIRHIAFSSIPCKRRQLLRALLVAGGTLNAAAVEKILGVSRPTALSRMRELAATGIVCL